MRRSHFDEFGEPGLSHGEKRSHLFNRAGERNESCPPTDQYVADFIR